MSNNIKKSFVLYVDLLDSLGYLSNEELGEIFRAILSYHNDKEFNLSSHLKIGFEILKQQFIRDNQKYQNIVERNQANGLKGGRPKNPEEPKKPSGLSGNPKNPEEPKKPDNDNDNDNDSESGNYNETEKDTELKKENILPIVPLQKKETAKINFALDFEKLSSEDQKLTYKIYQQMRVKAALSHEQIQDYLDKFNEFWINYTPIEDSKGGLVPRGDKKDCRVKYLRLLHAKESHEEIMKGLASYLKLCLKSGRQSCGIAVFMNQRRWEGLEDLNSVKAVIPKPKSRICDWMDD